MEEQEDRYETFVLIRKRGFYKDNYLLKEKDSRKGDRITSFANIPGEGIVRESKLSIQDKMPMKGKYKLIRRLS